jgi:hypothetical protein
MYVELSAPDGVAWATAQHWRAFALGVYDVQHLTGVRRVTALQYGTTSRLVPVSGAWAWHIYNVLLRLVSSADSTLQGCFKFRTRKWCVDYGTATVRLRAWPLRPTAPGIGAWSYGTATARLRAWCLRRTTEPDSGACSVDAALVCLVFLCAWCQ